MGLLDEDAHARLSAFLDGDTDIAEVQSEPEPEVETSSEPAEDVNQEAGVEAQSEEPEEAQAAPSQEADSEADGTETAEEDASGHRVPYNRFKQMVDARNTLRVEAVEMKTRLGALEEQAKIAEQVRSVLPQQQPAQQEQITEDRGLFSDLLDDVGPQQAPTPAVDPRIDALMDRMQQQEVALARRELEVEIATATEAHPGVPRSVLLQAVVADPNTPVMSVAESYSTHLAQIEEAAIARYLQENPVATEAEAKEVIEEAKAAPRPTKSGSVDSSVGAGEQKITSVREGSAALRAAWGNLNPFS
jgi:hypothetical protein